MTKLLLGHGDFYRPQRSCGQGNIFTPVCHSVHGGVSASVHAGIPHPPSEQTPQTRPPEARYAPQTRYSPPPRDQVHHPRIFWGGFLKNKIFFGFFLGIFFATPAPLQADSGIRSTSGRYASYWNAFLLH